MSSFSRGASILAGRTPRARALRRLVGVPMALVLTASVLTVVPGGVPSVAAATSLASPDSTYVPLATSVRIVDSRIGQGAGVFRSKTKQVLTIWGQGGVASGAVAITGNVTVIYPTAAGYLTVAPSLTSGSVPSTSTINFPYNDIRSAGITVGLSATGTLDAMYWAPAGTGYTTGVILEVTGYFSTTGHFISNDDEKENLRYHVLSTPRRVLNTRDGIGSSTFVAGIRKSFYVTDGTKHDGTTYNPLGVPATAVAVTGNVTVVGQTAAGYVTVAKSIPYNQVPPTSTVNFPVGDIRANGVTLGVTPGVVRSDLTTEGATLDAVYWVPGGGINYSANIIFDVTGYFTNGVNEPADPNNLMGYSYMQVTPSRVVDSRLNLGVSGPLSARVKKSLSVLGGPGVVPPTAVAVTGTVTIIRPTVANWVAIAPGGTLTSGVQPVSTINFPAGDIRSTGVTVGLSGGSFDAMYWLVSGSGTADIIFDVTGYFLPLAACDNVSHCYSRAYENSEATGYTGVSVYRQDVSSLSLGDTTTYQTQAVWLLFGVNPYRWIELGTQWSTGGGGHYYWADGTGGSANVRLLYLTPQGLDPVNGGWHQFRIIRMDSASPPCEWDFFIDNYELPDHFVWCGPGVRLITGLEVSPGTAYVRPFSVEYLQYRTNDNVWHNWAGQDGALPYDRDQVTPHSRMCGHWFSATEWQAGETGALC